MPDLIPPDVADAVEAAKRGELEPDPAPHGHAAGPAAVCPECGATAPAECGRPIAECPMLVDRAPAHEPSAEQIALPLDPEGNR